MAYTYNSAIRHVKKYYQYLNGSAHNNKNERNLAVDSINMLPEEIIPYDDQILQNFKHALKENCRYPCYSLIVSFSRNEFNAKEPDDIRKARDLMQYVLPQMYPDRQIAIYFQADGRSDTPCLHCHCIIGNLSLKDKLALKQNREFHRVKSEFNRLASEALDYDGKHLITLDYGHGSAERQSKCERGMHIHNKESSTKKFVLKDLFKKNIKAAMDIAESREEFRLLMEGVGFEIEYRTADMNLRTDPAHGASKEFGDYYLIKLKDTSLIPDNTRIKNMASKSFKLGPDYSLDTLDNAFMNNRKNKTNLTESEFKDEAKNIVNSIEAGPDESLEVGYDMAFINGDLPVFEKSEGETNVEAHAEVEEDINHVSKGKNAKESMLSIRDKEDKLWAGEETLVLSAALQRTESSRRLARLLMEEAQNELEYERQHDFSL